MTRTHRILWGEGLFLRPQHFQQQARFLEAGTARALALGQAYPWGVEAVRLDAAALAEGMLGCEELQVLFPDGTFYDAPGQEPLPRVRSLADLPGAGDERLVWACLPVLDAAGGNAGGPGRDEGRPVRFGLDRVLVPDLHTEAPEAELTVLRAQVRLRVDGEDRDGQHALPVARLRRAGAGAWAPDPDYLPPVLAVRAAPPLLALLRELHGLLRTRRRALAGNRRERAGTVAEYGAGDVASFWLQHAVSRCLPDLAHILDSPRVHPETAYRLLAQLAGELTTFSTAIGPEDVPAYRHDHLTGTFRSLGALVRELLDAVIPVRCLVLPLRQERPSFHAVRLEGDRLGPDCGLYLAVTCDRPAAEVLEAVPRKLKVGAPDDVDRLLHSALPGVHLAHAARTPAAVPVRVGSHYFALEPGPILERMLAARSVCVYAPRALPPMTFDLIAVLP
jgi:type VI secretion system protein ImpJ